MSTSLLQKYKPSSPAVAALLIQLASLCFIAAFLSVLWRMFQFKISLNQVVIFQALLVLIFTRWLNLAWWWCVIQPLFPFVVVLMLFQPLPPYVYLLLFLFFLVFYWTTFQTQVPYYPSGRTTWLAVEKLLPEDRPVSFIDIGSGLGGLTLFLAKRHPKSTFSGAEIAPLPWLFSYCRLKLSPDLQMNAQFLRRNYETMDFSEFDIVFAYLSPAAMSALWVKARKEMRPGTILVSYEFPINEVEADLSVNPADDLDNNQNGRKLFVWKM